jgi:hypothetical protein
VVVVAGSMVVAAVVVFVAAAVVDSAVAAVVDSAVVVAVYSAVAVTAAGSDMEEALDMGTADSGTVSDLVWAWGIGAAGGIHITDITDIHIMATLIPTTITPTRIPVTIRVRL